MKDLPSSRTSKSDVGIGMLIGVGLFATALGCGVIALGPLTAPIGIGAVLAGGVGGALFQDVKPGINKELSKITSDFKEIINNINTPPQTFEIRKPERIKDILQLFKLENPQK